MAVQIFMSYARADDELPPNRPNAKGFVTCLLEQLQYEFVDLGAAHALEVWRDIRKIDQGDQFDPIIEDAIKESTLFLAVLSPNWMASENCREELESFLDRWRDEGELRVKQRIIVACKKFVERGKRPSLMQGQQGYDFFSFEGPKETGGEIPYFARGEIRDDRYEAVVEQLADFLNRRAQHATRPPAARTGAAAADAVVDPPPPRTPAPTKPQASGRKIYLAKPASDMRAAYARLVEELTHSGYAVVPDPGADCPQDGSAVDYIDGALNAAELSIHLLGKSGGFIPEQPAAIERALPIVHLQLARAAARIKAASGQGAGPGNGFRRIIWAPEVLEDGVDPSTANGTAANGNATQPQAGTERRPDQVLKQFGEFEPTDKVIGGTLSKFVDFLNEHLAQSDVALTEPVNLSGDDWVYVYHAAGDAKYARDLAKALRQRGIKANLPALNGDAGDVNRLHQQFLLECSAVVLCWAEATEVWARMRANELNWRKLGRNQKFAYRGLVAYPPPDESKTTFVEVPPFNEIDITVDATKPEQSINAAIEPFVQLARPHVQ